MQRHHWKVWLLFIVCIFWDTVVVVGCPEKCICDSSEKSVSCKRTKFRSIPGGIPHNTKQLNLQTNGLKEIPAKTFLDFPQLETLNLNDNKIQMLANGAFQGLSRLQELKLSGNNLQLVLRGAFRGLQNVTRLDLDRNKLVVLLDHSFSGMNNLGYLDLGENQIIFIGDKAFKGLSKLKNLYLMRCRFTKMSYMTKALRYLPSLEFLRMQSFPIDFLPENAFPSLPYLKSLDLGLWRSLRAIHPQAFNGLNITVLNLNNGNLTNIPTRALQKLSRLKELHLSRNDIRVIRANDFLGMDKLEMLVLTHMQLEVIQEFAFTSLNNLRRLDLSNNNLKMLRRTSFGLKKLPDKMILDNNLWNCNCDLKWILTSYNAGDVSVICDSPTSWRGADILKFIRKPTAMPKNYTELMTCAGPKLVMQRRAISVTAGQDVPLRCPAKGKPSPTVNWVIPKGVTVTVGRPYRKTSLNNKGTLLIQRISQHDAGRYKCYAYNGGGNITDSIEVTVIGQLGRGNAGLAGPTPRPPDHLTLLLATLMGSLTFLGVVIFCCSIIFLWSRGYKQGKQAFMMELAFVPRGSDEGGKTKSGGGSLATNVNFKRAR
ncbi:PREDICTED: LOW QUALITY PROTEIN: leucine-rich repeat and immunoglobulin-like domain-containing nogo receptor-interacting protein 2 [Branchiostoma belcheri]|uniref:LOW QUALITY PROTEIN: leucine-rich repeat and immunoglobulin-like domain-containing nogo receptor-interacting protein 2 n=1 Tax=Branchiostoma belcheri TaxID=7741 RepID=A0A6P4Z450_BRABE|nr:PREDICTED: LOW QUALITY PROTEIN: leucine-rich repeat and immunoglobulin-like domain-containing nogo receptor-interacting protein 2 [Branchiostoma belcheri]KAI8508174.1 Leucine-rich repeat and immunoglobulin-like domain-containing nogo receptor-interacting protein 2 [Branchiostoma belcheri]